MLNGEEIVYDYSKRSKRNYKEVAIKAAAQEGKSWIFFDCDNHTELIFLMKYLNSNGYKVNHSILHGEFSVSILLTNV